MHSSQELSQSKNRNFICSCGKAYLSYAALFTHIKQKHGGKAPGEIIRPRSENKRGRPRKNDKPSNQKLTKNDSNNKFLENINLKNTNYISYQQLQEKAPQLKRRESGGFSLYDNQKASILKHRTLSKNAYNTPNQQSKYSLNHMFQNSAQSRKFDQDHMEFANPNNELSSNTIAMASVIIGLKQFFKQANNLQEVNDKFLDSFQTFKQLKQFHQQQLKANKKAKEQHEVFKLGNIACAFLNFCHETLESRQAYQQVVLMMVCLLEHIKNKIGGDILHNCEKETIHEQLLTFFEEYLVKLIERFRQQRHKFWVLQENNFFKVLIWFLNWLSIVENNHKKTFQQKKQTYSVQLQNEYQNGQSNDNEQEKEAKIKKGQENENQDTQRLQKNQNQEQKQQQTKLNNLQQKQEKKQVIQKPQDVLLQQQAKEDVNHQDSNASDQQQQMLQQEISQDQQIQGDSDQSLEDQNRQLIETQRLSSEVR